MSEGAPPTGDLYPRKVPLVLFCASLFLYLVNADLPVVNDAMPAVYLPGPLLSEGRLTFAPEDAPFMFFWEAREGGRSGPVWIPSLDFPLGGRPAREWLADGRLKPLRSEYFLVPAQGPTPRYAGIYGPVAGLFGTPAALLCRIFGGSDGRRSATLWTAAKVTAAVLAAGSVVCIYFAALAWIPGPAAAILAGSYATGTHLWSVASQALWQQTPVIFLYSLGLMLLLRGRPSLRSAALCGLALGCAFAGRATAAIVVAAVGLHLFLGDRKAALAFALGALPPVLLILLYGVLVHGSPVGYGQLEQAQALSEAKCGAPGVWQTSLWLGATGVLLSPSRGLLVYSPLLAFSFWGLVRSVRYPEWRPFFPVAVGVCGLFLAAFKWFDWWGGWSFGYRLVTDLVPLLALLLIPVARDLLAVPGLRRVALVLLGWSVLVQILGAFAYEPGGWNNRRAGFAVQVPGEAGERRLPTAEEAQVLARSLNLGRGAIRELGLNVDHPEHRSRLWSVADSQLVHLLGRFSESRTEKRRVSRLTLDVLP